MDFSLPSRVIQGGEINQLLLRGRLLDHQEHRASLCHGLDDEEAWHDHRTAPIAAEEGLVGADILQAADANARFHLDDAVHEKKGKSMWKQLEKVLDVHCWVLPAWRARIARFSERLTLFQIR